jgi:cell division protein FtsA
MAAVKPIYAVGLDAGGRRTRVVICTLEEGRLRFLGAGASESQGWSKGRIADQGAATASILAAVREAEHAAGGISLESAVVGMGGSTVRGHSGRGVLELGFVREIDQRDVNRVVDRASRVHLLEDRMVLQLFPQDFVVDDHPGHRDPRKMLAARLEINVHLITCSVMEHNSLVGAVNEAHLLVEETAYEALAACYAAVLPEHRREGIAVVDIGAQSTELVIYYGDAMQLASTVPVCGDHFTRDLAQGLCLSFEDAEMVKLEFGTALAGNTPNNVLLELPSIENREARQAKRKKRILILLHDDRPSGRLPLLLPILHRREPAAGGVHQVRPTRNIDEAEIAVAVGTHGKRGPGGARDRLDPHRGAGQHLAGGMFHHVAADDGGVQGCGGEE